VAAAFAVAKSIAADLLAGTWTNNGVRVSTALSQLHQRNIVMVLVVVTRYVAVVIEAASEENSRIWEAHDQVSAAASTGFGPLS
jgi:urea transporter